MDKQAFLNSLRSSLKALSKEDVDKYAEYYSEMIDDRMEDGLTEEEAVAAVGLPEELAGQLLPQTPQPRLGRKLRVWEIVLLILGAPVWLSLLITVVSVAFAAYVVLWSAVIVLYAADITLWAIGFAGVVAGIAALFIGNWAVCAALTGLGLFCAGLALFMEALCRLSAKGMILLTKAVSKWIRSLFV